MPVTIKLIPEKFSIVSPRNRFPWLFGAFCVDLESDPSWAAGCERGDEQIKRKML
jgi:hypothetical protein